MTSKMVVVEWIDSLCSNGWTTILDQKSFQETTCFTCGFLIHETEGAVTVALSIDPGNGNINQSIAIPRVAILKIIELRKK